MTRLAIVENAPRIVRKLRQPKHSYQVRTRPWQIQPFMIAPVLPGETLKSLRLQETVVSDPLKSKLIGWWHEHHWFYVKHRDLDARSDLIAMHLTGAALTPHKRVADSLDFYTTKNGVNWVELCLKRVTEEFFRNEGEAWDAFKVGNLPAASINQDSYLDSVIDDTIVPGTGNELQDPQSDDGIMATYLEHYNRMRQMRMTSMTFDDWLKSHGIRGVQTAEPEDMYKPEMLRSVREFVYPTNTVEPTTGAPTTAMVQRSAIRGDKDRFFKEPGFIIGVVVSRPKVYLSNQKGAATAALDEARLWLPALLRDEAYTSLREHVSGASADGPLGNVPTAGYWIDYRDLFLYGDQFVNFDIATAGDGSSVALPTAALQRRYASAAMADALFTSAAPANQLRMDGVCQMSILGTVGPDQT